MDENDVVKAQLMDDRDLSRTLNRMARQIVETLSHEEGLDPMIGLIGMQRRGVFIAQRLQSHIEEAEGMRVPLGVLDATMYRDDFRLRLKQPYIRETKIDFDISDRHLVLVDDVLYTGRTARAALDALMDMGRPASIHFLVIIDRGLRELPIRADFVGRRIPTFPGEEVCVCLLEIDDSEGVWLVEHQSEDANLNPSTD